MSIEYGYTDNITHIAEKQSIQQIAAQSAQHQQDTVNAACIIFLCMMIKIMIQKHKDLKALPQSHMEKRRMEENV